MKVNKLVWSSPYKIVLYKFWILVQPWFYTRKFWIIFIWGLAGWQEDNRTRANVIDSFCAPLLSGHSVFIWFLYAAQMQTWNKNKNETHYIHVRFLIFFFFCSLSCCCHSALSVYCQLQSKSQSDWLLNWHLAISNRKSIT